MRAPQLSLLSLALASAWLLPQHAHAAEYLVSNDAEFRAAMLAARTDGDPSATIRLTSSFTLDLGVSLAQPGKPIVVDSNGFVLTSTKNPGGSVIPFVTSPAASLVFNGTFNGESATTAGNGIAIVSGSGGQVTINGTVTGGDQTGATGGGGVGVSFGQRETITNNGTITGGRAASGFSTANSSLSAGVSLQNGDVLLNTASGVIAGGSGLGTGGTGVYVANTVNSTLDNQGIIRGGTDLSGGSAGGIGIRFATAFGTTLNNSGLIEAGAGAPAIFMSNASSSISIVNSGTIRGGSGANAIEFATGTGVATLELQAGSTIVGNVIASAVSTTDVLRLGGDTDSVFDVSSIGNAAQYRNFDLLEKTGASTWALIGEGTSTAPWTVKQGTLQVGNGGTSGSLAGDVEVQSGATLAFNRSDASTYAGVISGDGALVHNGSGTTTLTGVNTYTGPTTINFGTLAVDGSINSPVSVMASGTLSGSGTVFGDVTNSGAITPGGGSGTLTIDGNYIGNGGVIRLSSVLGDDSSSSGRLVVTGDTSGTSTIAVTNLAGLGAQTVEGIKLIDVQGLSNGVFSLAGDYRYQGQAAIVSGAYAYRLYKNGVTDSSDGDWYLRSTLDSTGTVSPTTPSAPLLAPTVGLYESYASVLQRFNQLGTLHDRIGNRYWQPDAEVEAQSSAGMPAIGRGAWVRVEGSEADINPATSTTDADFNVHSRTFETGFDVPVYESPAGTLVVGPTAHYGKADSSVSSLYGDGSIDVTGYGVGLTATWYGNDGTYVDGQTTVTRYDSDLRSSQLGRKLVEGNRGHGVAASIEVGHRLALDDTWSVTPQAQLAWSRVRFDGFTDQYGAEVSQDDGNSLVTRLGVMLDRETRWKASDGSFSGSRLYGITNLYYDFDDGTSADISDLHVRSKEQALWAGLGVGGALDWDNRQSTLFGELLGRTSLQDFGDSHSVGARVGVRVMW